MAQQYLGPFANIEFAPYKFEEYPKWVEKKDGTKVLVKSQRDEILLATELAPDERAMQEKELATLAEQNAKLLDELAALKAVQAPSPILKPQPNLAQTEKK